MCGLPRSGKSTWIKKNAKDYVVISPDRIRKLIFGHQFHNDAEEFVWAYAKGMAKLLLEQGKNVLIDATNLNYPTRAQWYAIAFTYDTQIKIVWLKTSLKECKDRNANSPEGEKLPEGVLDRMASIFVNPTEDVSIKEAYNIELVEIPPKGCSKFYVSGNIYLDETLKEVKTIWKTK
jgi:predicted kinase